MDYKKKYKEALERAKGIHSFSSDIAEIKRMEQIFPELAESENERIRKAQLDYWRSVGGKEWHGVPVQEVIAWLEKQCKQDDYDDNIITRDDEILQAISVGLTDVAKDAGWSDFGGLPIEDIMDWIEKQGNEKEYTFKSLPRLLEMIEPTKRVRAYCQKLIDTLINEGYAADAKIVCECLRKMCGEKVALATMDEKQGEQKSADEVKVEPKFKVGDWIVWKDKCYKVNDNGCGYELIDTNGLSTSLEYGTVDENAHLWNIQDAKNGDVLLLRHKQPFIYNGIFDNESIGAYCGISSLGHYFLKATIPCNWSYKEGVTPATKEQRNQLEKAITDSGYEWDAEKKELRKIETPSNSWTEDDEKNLLGVIDEIKANKSNAPDYDIETYDRFLSWLESLKQRMI